MTDHQSSLRGRRRILLCVVTFVGSALAVASCSTSPTRSSSPVGARTTGARTTAARTTGARTTLQLAHDQAGPALRLARAARANGDFASAINLYRSVTALPPVEPALLIELGDTLVDAGSMDDAIEVYQRAALNAGTRVEALLGLQRAFLALAEFDRAMQYADEAVAIAPMDHRVLIGRGVALDLVGRHAPAQEAYRAVLVSTPFSVAARNDLALSLAMTGHFNEAIGIMTAMARSSTATPRIRQNLALIYGLAGDAPHADALSRIDLDGATVAGNLRFFEFARAEVQ